MFEQATPCRERRGAAFARHLPKAASLENNKAPDIAPEAYSLSMICCFISRLLMPHLIVLRLHYLVELSCRN